MLGSCHQFIVSLQTPHKACSHLGNQRRGFPIGFTDAAPTGIPAQIEEGRVGCVNTVALELSSDRLAHLLGKLRLPGGGHAEGLRESRGSRNLRTGDRFAVGKDRNPKTGMPVQILLDPLERIDILLRISRQS